MRLLARAAAAAAALAGAVVAAQTVPTPAQLLANMTLVDKIGQMTQLTIETVLASADDATLDPAKLATVLGQFRVGSILNSPYAGGCTAAKPSGWTVADWRSIIAQLQAFAAANGTDTTPFIPVIYGVDSVHGANYIANATMFPHNTGAAACFNPSLYRAQATVTALDTRTAGIPWMFSPVLGLLHNPLWSRSYETLGEDPFLAKTYAAAYFAGAADADAAAGVNFTVTAPCMKHFYGYSSPRSGKDRTDAWIPDAYLKQYFEPAFAAAVAAGAPTVMVNSGSVAGVPVHASGPLLTDVLRTQLGFTGVAVSDWQDIEKLTLYHATAATPGEAIAQALTAGVDMSMVPSDTSFPAVLLQLVQNGTIPESRIDESVLRILQLKLDTGLFAAPVVPPQLVGRQLGGAADQELSLNATRESITLLQNAPVAASAGANVLPLTWLRPGASVLVVGPSSVDCVALCGGWTLTWGGAASCEFMPGTCTSIAAGVTALAAAAGINVTSLQGVTFTSADPGDLAAVTAAAAAADVVIMAVGEAPESETPGDIQDLTLSPSQMALFGAINATATPLVTVLVEPRPRVLGGIPARSAAVLMAYLPCVHGGQAIAEVLFGITNPSGRLPLTYPSATGDLDVYWHKPWNATLQGVPEAVYHDPLYTFGAGLSYSDITYSDLVISPAVAAAGDAVNVSFTLKNGGPYDAKEASLLFVRQLYRAAITPETTMLKGFTKTALAAGAAATVTITLDTADLAYWTPSLEFQIDAGVYSLSVGGLSGQLTLSSPARFDYVPGSAAAGGRTFRLVRPSEEAALAAADAAKAVAAGLEPAAAGLLGAAMAELDAAGVRGPGAAPRRVVLHQVRQRLLAALGGQPAE